MLSTFSVILFSKRSLLIKRWENKSKPLTKFIIDLLHKINPFNLNCALLKQIFVINTFIILYYVIVFA